ncbi:alpha/beta-hydrolase [Hymenopellis radicata]|nr:alpha/beta-hydrolase [Hymenopellis radicata]
MVALLGLLSSAFFLVPHVLSSPINPLLEARQSITTLSASAIAAFKPYTYYASTAWCDASVTLTWTCGRNCDANPDFKPVASGGNSDSVQFWYVGYDPNLNTVIVAHQGTDTSHLLPILTDGDFFLSELDDNLFPNLSSDIKVHSGFKEAQENTATTVLASVKSAMSTFSTNAVTIVGHSLGGAIALLDGQVGNEEFADYVDAHVSVSRVINREDLFPILPGQFMGYHHCAGEKHILDSGKWVACPGHGNDDERCSAGDVDFIFEGNTVDHTGPYDGVEMGC